VQPQAPLASAAERLDDVLEGQDRQPISRLPAQAVGNQCERTLSPGSAEVELGVGAWEPGVRSPVCEGTRRGAVLCDATAARDGVGAPGC
jgi:hypothetical protein